MSVLVLPEGYAPSNLHLGASNKVRYVENDVFDICRRLAHVDPCLYVVELEATSKVTRKKKPAWVIMERCLDGVSRQVCKVEELDARAIEKVEEMRRIPFAYRLRVIEAENEKWERDYQDNELERIYEQMGHAFQRQLWHDGFTDSRPISYPTRAIKPTRD